MIHATTPTLLELGLQHLQAEAERQYGEPLSTEQIMCWNNPARFAEAHGMLDDMESRERMDVDLPRQCLGSKIATLLRMFPNLSETETGGGCMAYHHPIEGTPEGYLLITDGEMEDCLPTDASEEVCVGIYSGEPDDNGETDAIKLDDLPEWIQRHWMRK